LRIWYVKHQVEETLAQQADGGVIVEIGVGHGNGLRALWGGTAAGRRLPLYGIDPFLPYRDPLGGEYGPECKAETLAAIAPFAAHVTLVEYKAEDAARDWRLPIALLWLDLSMPYEQLRAILDLWSPFVIPGGVLGITGLEYGNLGTRQLYQELGGNGWQAIMTDQDKVAVLRKATPRRGAFYVVSNADSGRYVREARNSAASVKQCLNVETWLFSPDAVDSAGFDHVGRLPARSSDFWYLDSTRWMNLAAAQFGDGWQLLCLDSDTHVCVPCPELWHLLNHYDLAVGHSASRDATDSALGTPASFPTFQVGVMLFNNTPSVRALFADWLDYYERYWRIYENNDEAALRDALWACRGSGVRWICLAPEYCLRFDFGAWVNGRVRILHGRVGGISTDRMPLDATATEINSDTRMRHWHHGLGRTG
jgi:hypothetical protein